MPELDPRDAFYLAFIDWISALVLARSVGGAAEIASALDATERMHRALESYAAGLAPGTVDAAAPLGRLRGRIDASLRWLYGRKSGTILPPKL
jgi:hypothetical protein